MNHVLSANDRYRWVIFGVLWTSYIVVFLNRLSIGPLAPFLKEELELNSAQIGLVMSAASFGSVITRFPTGWLVDKIGAKWPIVSGEIIAGISMITLFFSTSYAFLLIFMFVTGVGCGFLIPSTSQGVIVWFPVKERATVMGLKQTGVNLGGIITATTLPALALALGWRFGFLILGILALAVGALALIAYREPLLSAISRTFITADRKISAPLTEFLKSREIWLMALAGFCLAWVEMALVAHLVLYLTEVILLPVITAGGLLAMAETAGAVFRPGSGLVSDRIFHGTRKPLLMMLAGISAIGCFVLALFGSHLSWVLYPVLFILGMGGIGFGGLFLTLISEFGGRSGAGRSAGLASTIMGVGSMLGPIMFGYIVDLSGSYALAWLSLTLVAAICIPLLFFVREEKRKV